MQILLKNMNPKNVCLLYMQQIKRVFFVTLTNNNLFFRNALGHKIVGYPIRIDSSRYERNAYLFNLCFVCDSWSKTVQYEPVVKKLGEHLVSSFKM